MDNKRKKRLFFQIPFLCALIIGSVLIIAQQHNAPYQHDTGAIFGTIYNIDYQYDHDLNDEIIAELNKVDAALSMFNEKSVISMVNRNEKVEVNDMFTEVFRMAEDISEETGGAFDITVAPLVNLWGFGFKTGNPPTKHTVDSIRAFVGYKGVSLKGRTITKKDPRTMLDCSAIAKGYGSDVVARFLESKGISNYMIEIGGEVVTKGISKKRLPWRIGVTKPTDDSLSTNGELQAVLNVTDMAMATSGNYRKFYYRNGKKYAHTIDPATGKPVQHSLLSATVLAKQCAKADAYATSFMVMGMERAKEVLAKHPELMAYFIYTDQTGQFKVWCSPSMKGKIID